MNEIHVRVTWYGTRALVKCLLQFIDALVFLGHQALGGELGIFIITCLKLGWSQLYLGGDIAATPTQTQLSELLWIFPLRIPSLEGWWQSGWVGSGKKGQVNPRVLTNPNKTSKITPTHNSGGQPDVTCITCESALLNRPNSIQPI